MATFLPDSSSDGNSPDAGGRHRDDPGLGELLRSARERCGLTIEQVASETKIPRHHLQSLEDDNLTVLPGGFYSRAQVRTYARAVRLDQNLAVARLERALAPPTVRNARREAGRGQEPIVSRKRLLIAAAVIVGAVVFGRALGGLQRPRDDDAQVLRTIETPSPAVRPAAGATRDDADTATRHIQADDLAPPPVSPASTTVPTPAAATPPAVSLPVIPVTPSVAADAPAATLAPPPTPAGASPAAAAPAPTPAPAGVAVPAAQVSGLVVTTRPAGARVTVNGIGWGVTPVSIRYLATGDKRIRVSKEGYSTEERVIHVVEGERKVVDITLPPE
jgi:cytoskeletal protein RodZ